MKIKSLTTMLIVATTAFCWTSCKDNDDNMPFEQANNDHTLSPSEIADFAVKNFIWNVCDVEEDTTTMQWKSWEVSYGRALHSETPYVRYAQTNSREEARQRFLDMICSEASVDSSSVIGTIFVDMGSHGYVKYTPVYEKGEWAHVDVNLKELPDLQTIVFCNQEAWPVNGHDCGVDIGTVFKRNEKGHIVYYICIKKCDGNHYGYLIGFDTWTIDVTGPSDHTFGKSNKKCYDPKWELCAGGLEIMEYLHGFLYNADGERVKDAENIIREISKVQGGHPDNVKKCGDSPLYNFLYSEGKLKERYPMFKAGKEANSVETCTNSDGTYHFIRNTYTIIAPKFTRWSKICFNCCGVDPQGDKGSWDMWTASTNDHWPYKQFGYEWVWKAGEWYCFQKPYVITFWDTDASTLQQFRDHYTLESGNLDI